MKSDKTSTKRKSLIKIKAIFLHLYLKLSILPALAMSYLFALSFIKNFPTNLLKCTTNKLTS